MHFKLDENVPVRLKSILEDFGWKASTVFDENLSGKQDKDIIGVCRLENFVLITPDNDFSNPIAYPPGSHNGIVVIKTEKQGSDIVIGMFKNLLNIFDIKDLGKSILIVEKNITRLRK